MRVPKKAQLTFSLTSFATSLSFLSGPHWLSKAHWSSKCNASARNSTVGRTARKSNWTLNGPNFYHRLRFLRLASSLTDEALLFAADEVLEGISEHVAVLHYN
ncbi:hypothetical protein EV356DRAFT_294662 [Viridothelium virens]|uniref:Uncharacterized protein n=1 Tax=Viridothelium virens TaxID=1048519 RepID=A0A6A6GZZ5_VIRVR|nr:hypothetical protein EV356DRAFT_294662 [Viridothelium virens]